jgi:hypothetical protein
MPETPSNPETAVVYAAELIVVKALRAEAKKWQLAKMAAQTPDYQRSLDQRYSDERFLLKVAHDFDRRAGVELTVDELEADAINGAVLKTSVYDELAALGEGEYYDVHGAEFSLQYVVKPGTQVHRVTCGSWQLYVWRPDNEPVRVVTCEDDVKEVPDDLTLLSILDEVRGLMPADEYLAG